MAARTLPGALALIGFWNYATDLWGTTPNGGMNGNLQRASILTQLAVIEMVAALPGSPTDGDIYILTTDKTINARDNGAWVALTPTEGMIAWDKATEAYYYFDGSDWVSLLADIEATVAAAVAVVEALSNAYGVDVVLNDDTWLIAVKVNGAIVWGIRKNGDNSGYMFIGGVEYSPTTMIQAVTYMRPALLKSESVTVTVGDLLYPLLSRGVRLEGGAAVNDMLLSSQSRNDARKGPLFDGATPAPSPGRAYVDGVMCRGGVVQNSRTLVVDAADILYYISGLGESTYGYGGMSDVNIGERAVTTTAPNPTQSLMFRNETNLAFGSAANDDGEALDEDNLTDLIPSVENDDYGEASGTSMMRWLAKWDLDNAKPAGVRAFCTFYKSGSELVDVMPGTVQYTNSMKGMKKALEFAAIYGFRSMEVIAVTGEIGANDRETLDVGNQAAKRIEFRDNLLELAEQQDIDFRTGYDSGGVTHLGTRQRAPVWTLLRQLASSAGTGINADTSVISLATMDAMRTEGSLILISCCLYWIKDEYGYISIAEGGLDDSNVHRFPLASAVAGELESKALLIIREAMKLDPLAQPFTDVEGLGAALGDPGNDYFATCLIIDITSVARSGTTVTWDLIGRDAATLVFDTSLVPNVGTGKGFSYSTATLTNATIVGTTGANRVHMSATISSGVDGILYYAYAEVSQIAGSATCRGNVRANKAFTSEALPSLTLYDWLCADGVACPYVP